MNYNDITVLKGPYSLVWRDGRTDSKEYSNSCYDVNMWGCDMIWDNEGYQWVPVHSKDYEKWYEIYFASKGISKANYVSTIIKAIDNYKLKQSLSPEAAKTFEDIIDEL